MKRNWIPKQLVSILFVTLRAKSFFETINVRFLEDVDFVEGDTVRNIIFDEENIIIPSDVIGIKTIPDKTLLMTQFKTMLLKNLLENKHSLLKKLCH